MTVFQKAAGPAGPWGARGSGLVLPPSQTGVALGPEVLLPKTGSHTVPVPLWGLGCRPMLGRAAPETSQKP